jgi:hypothetical protein
MHSINTVNPIQPTYSDTCQPTNTPLIAHYIALPNIILFQSPPPKKKKKLHKTFFSKAAKLLMKSFYSVSKMIFLMGG